MPSMEQVIEACASAAHEVKVPWDDAPEWQKTSARNGAVGALSGNTPEQSHESWLKEKRATGWKYGPKKNLDTKEHPCFVPYAELPLDQRVKDGLFVTTVRAMGAALGWSPAAMPR